MSSKTISRKRTQFLVMFIFVLSGITIMACRITAFIPESSTEQDPTPNPTGNSASISGIVWNDLCASSSQGELPRGSCVFDPGRELYLANGILEAGEPGLPGVEVSIGKGLCPSRGLDAVISGNDGAYTFEALSPGEYCITVHFPVGSHQAKLVPGVWTYPKSDSGRGVDSITISLSDGERKGRVNFGWDSLLDFTDPEAEPTNTPLPQPACSYKATFVEDVTFLDGEQFSPGEEFSKVWRLKNTGTCVWKAGFSLVFMDGDQMDGFNAKPISTDVSPGDEIDVEVALKAPDVDGTYKGYWMLRSDGGEVFGIGDEGDKPFWVKISVGKAIVRDSVISWTPELNPEKLAKEGRWVDVDLGQQLLTAYEGSTPVMRFVVSTGTASHPTVAGQFRIWVKLEATDMSGPGYSLKDVPYTMYFYQGYGLHGTYWHNNFGTPMSHGCVNLQTSDAAWLFDFVQTGTLVNVHP